MTGMTSYPPSRSSGRKSRWIGRSSILANYPAAPEWMRLMVLTLSFLGLQLVWSCQLSQASPYLISLGFSKSMMALVFLAGPLSGLIVQPVVGVLSDACHSRLGRRRPFIIGGCLISSIAVLVFGRTREIAALFSTSGGSAHTHLTKALAILSIYSIDFSINVVQAVDRSLLVDVVPPHLQADANAWAGRLYGIGAVIGYWIGGADLVYWTRGWLGSDQLKVLTLFTSFFLCATHTVTCVCVRERVLLSKYDDVEYYRGNAATRAMEDIWTTLTTLPKPIQQVFNVQFSSWIGWFPILFFGTTWIAETYSRSYNGTDLVDAPSAIQALATRAGSRAMLFSSIISLLTSIILPFVIAPSSDTFSRPPNLPSFPSVFQSFLDRFFPLSWLSLSLLWTFSNGCFALLLCVTYFATSVSSATIVIALTGFSWAVSNWAPFALLGDLILRTGPSTGPPAVASIRRPSWDRIPETPSSFDSNGFSPARPKENTSPTRSTSPIEPRQLESGFVTPPMKEWKHSLASNRESATEEDENENDMDEKRESSPTDTETSDAFFDASTGTPRSDKSITPTQHPYRGSGPGFDQPYSRTNLSFAIDHDASDSTINHSHHTLHLQTSPERLQQFSASSSTIFFHPDSYPSSSLPLSLGNNSNNSSEHHLAHPYRSPPSASAAMTPIDQLRTPTTLQLYHPDLFGSLNVDNLDPSEANLLRRSSSNRPSRRGSINVAAAAAAFASTSAGDGLPAGDEIEMGDEGEDEGQSGDWDELEGEVEGGGSDQAGVILGCHNIYLVLPQLIVTGLSSLIFALFAPQHSVLGSPHLALPPISSTATATAAAVVDAVGSALLARDDGAVEIAARGWDALGLIFRIGGVSAAISSYLCWRMTQDRARQARLANLHHH